VGQISTGGLYTPPATAGTHTVTATSVANSAESATASVAVTDLAEYHLPQQLVARRHEHREYALTSSNVNPTSFGKLFSCPVDGAAYTQPLWIRGLNIGGGIHNVILVATGARQPVCFRRRRESLCAIWQINLLDTTHGGSATEDRCPGRSELSIRSATATATFNQRLASRVPR